MIKKIFALFFILGLGLYAFWPQKKSGDVAVAEEQDANSQSAESITLPKVALKAGQNSSSANSEGSSPLESQEYVPQSPPSAFKPVDESEYDQAGVSQGIQDAPKGDLRVAKKDFNDLKDKIPRGSRRECLEAKNKGWFLYGESPKDYSHTVTDDGHFRFFSAVVAPSSHVEFNHCYFENLEAGQTFRFSAEVKNSEMSGYANIHVRSQDSSGEYGENQKKGLGSTRSGWRPLAVEIVVPEKAEALVFGLTLEGEGWVEVRNISLEKL